MRWFDKHVFKHQIRSLDVLDLQELFELQKAVGEAIDRKLIKMHE